MAERRREDSRSAAGGGMARSVGKDKDRDREKERDRLKERDRDREKGREKEEREKGRDKEEEKGKERDREKEEKEKGSKDKERERDKDKEHRAKEKDRDRAKEKERELEKERQREKDKERQREKDRERELERDRQKQKQKERDRDREREREREIERDRDTDRERDRDRDRDNERDRPKSKLRDKDREQDAEKKNEREKPRDERDKCHKGPPSAGIDGESRTIVEKERQKPKQKESDAEKREERERHRDEQDRSHKESQHASAELEARVLRMREERLKSNADRRSARKTEPENLAAEDDISAWVNKSRKLEMEKAAQRAKMLSEQDDNEEEEDSMDEGPADKIDRKNLAGVKVRHGLDQVMEGGSVVLTLKDSNILAGDDVNEEVDELENIEIAQQQQREEAYRAAKKKPGIYEDKFDNDITGLASRSILPQYDDTVKDEAVVLDETGGIADESKQRLEEIRQKLQRIGSRMEQSLNSKAVAADFFTEEEMVQFKKPKKQKKLRKKNELELYALEAEAAPAGLGSSDHGARGSGSVSAAKKAEEEGLADARKSAYQSALHKAMDASKSLQQKGFTPMDTDEDTPVFGAEEDQDLFRSLARARQAALKKQAESSGAGTKSLAVRFAGIQTSEETSQAAGAEDKKEGEAKVVFTDTGEFCRSLQLDEAITRRAGPKDAFGEEEEEPPAVPMELEVPTADGGWTEVNEAANGQGAGDESRDYKDEPETPIKEVAVGKGLAGVLTLLKERGTLKETVDWGGRNMDKKRSKLVGIVDDSSVQFKRDHREIILDRVDEFGRTMTPKEAFRKLSHKFHGKGPGKMKQEKRMKQHQEELKLKQMNSGDTPLMSMEKIREAQANLHSPYIVISGHIKPGQTSDPRSGFATVEKEPIGSLTPMLGDKHKVGSLTPMLGDKKVEHFLGIKRKQGGSGINHNGSMGPPPPKKPKADH